MKTNETSTREQANPELINAYFNKFSKEELYKVHLPILISLLNPLDYREFIINQQITG